MKSPTWDESAKGRKAESAKAGLTEESQLKKPKVRLTKEAIRSYIPILVVGIL